MGEVGARTLEDFEQDYVLSTAETEVLGRSVHALSVIARERRWWWSSVVMVISLLNSG